MATINPNDVYNIGKYKVSLGNIPENLRQSAFENLVAVSNENPGNSTLLQKEIAKWGGEMYSNTPIPGQRQGLFNANDYLGQPNVVSSTTQLRDQDNANKLDAQNLLQSILGESATSDGLINNLYGMVGMTGETENERLLREMQRSIGLTTPEDIQQISAFGAQAESAYAPLIQEAEAAKAQGMPKATIGAGERGGFMNTQFAGVGALLPTQGGDFAGTGGILNQIKSEYDANISNLKAQARNARLVAEQAYREYLRTGKMVNYNVMMDAVNLEREKLAEALKRASELVNIVGNYQNIQQARMGVAQDLIKINPGETLYDPNTGEAIFTAPSKPSDNKPITEKTADGSIIQWNPTTQSWDTISVGGLTPYQQEQLALDWTKFQIDQDTGGQSPYRIEIAKNGQQAIKGLLEIAEDNPGIFGRTAALPIPDALRSDAFRNYKAQLEYLKGNIIPAALSAMREASKTGGALGQVSDREGAFLASSLGAIDMTQETEIVKEQLRLINDSFQRWIDAAKQYSGLEQSDPFYGVDINAGFDEFLNQN